MSRECTGGDAREDGHVDSGATGRNDDGGRARGRDGRQKEISP